MDNLDFLDFFDSSTKYGVVKATVHKTGKLGFSSGAIKYMNLQDIDFFNIGINRNDKNDRSLYLVPITDSNDKSFKVVKAGEYFYVYIKNILRDMNINYKDESVIYDIEKEEIDNKYYYKLTQREQK